MATKLIAWISLIWGIVKRTLMELVDLLSTASAGWPTEHGIRVGWPDMAIAASGFPSMALQPNPDLAVVTLEPSIQIDARHRVATPKIWLVGIGPHAVKTYLPELRRLESAGQADLCMVIELQANEAATRKIVGGYFGLEPDYLFVPPFTDKMPGAVAARLDERLRAERPDGIIIATEPQAHKPYALWALGRNLDVLMDKPITTRADAATKLLQARGIWQDFAEIQAAYRAAQRCRETGFVINAQRQVHPGFTFPLDSIRDIAERFGAPVTHIQANHSDGQWRTPDELVRLSYHGYNHGHGKVSHSGYHLFDMVSTFYRAGGPVLANRGECFSSFVSPRGFLRQFPLERQIRYLGRSVAGEWNQATLEQAVADYGEIDASMLYRFAHRGETVCNVSINLGHNSVSRRSWAQPNADLYKGMGRIKHEHWVIQQGMLQTIQIHSYQANDKHDVNTLDDFEVGGNNHFEIYRFRNCAITGDKQPLEIVNLRDLEEEHGLDTSKLASTVVKERLLGVWLAYVRGDIPKSALISPIENAALPVRLMSAAYESNARQRLGLSPLAAFPIS